MHGDDKPEDNEVADLTAFVAKDPLGHQGPGKAAHQLQQMQCRLRGPPPAASRRTLVSPVDEEGDYARNGVHDEDQQDCIHAMILRCNQVPVATGGLCGVQSLVSPLEKLADGLC